ncbi:MAG: cysteine hydrolase [Proteobacteria bacterium]|nr:cysteine hydrolase [Pseudomonadota bacterium]MBU4295354.1 cysteine hydrolase [Pseudomonadota bacterium]MCG2748210.1 cysteine hydrolase [Desulfobulbaceae bacterium]
MNTCLIVIDLQNDYFPGGNMELVGIEAAAANARLLLDRQRETGSAVIHIQHIAARPGATFFLPETTGAAINEQVAPRENEIVVQKNYPNSFRDTSLLEILQQGKVDNLLICGAMSHMCIDASVRAAFDFGFTCLVAEDACAARDLEFKGRTINAADVHASFMAALAVPYARVIATKEVLENI